LGELLFTLPMNARDAAVQRQSDQTHPHPLLTCRQEPDTQ
jgi:hypothetical protein